LSARNSFCHVSIVVNPDVHDHLAFFLDRIDRQRQIAQYTAALEVRIGYSVGLGLRGVALGLPGLEFIRGLRGSVGCEGGILLAHPREKGVLVDLLLGGGDLDVSMAVRLGLGSLVRSVRLYGGFTSLDEFDGFCDVYLLSLRLPSVQLSPDRLLFLFLEVDQECLLLGRGI
jgi:hypothetical protein